MTCVAEGKMVMTPATEPTTRKRDAAQTRQDLLDAARDLFGAKGYDQTSLREIGERAGVDAALIARYFGNKMALYSATVEADTVGAPQIASVGDIERLIRRLLRKADMHGLGPIIRTTIAPSSEIGSELREVAHDHVQRRIAQPLTTYLLSIGVAPVDAPLRAEALVSLIFGVVAVRAARSLPGVTDASHDAILTAVMPAVQALCEIEG